MAFRDRVRSALQELTKKQQPGMVLHNTVVESLPGVVVTDDSAMRFAECEPERPLNWWDRWSSPLVAP